MLAAGARVARIPLLFGPSFDGRRGATDMIRASSDGVTLYTNEHRTPLHVADAARGLVELLLEHYYDPLYRHSEHGRTYAFEIDSTDPARAARELAERIEAG